MQKKKNTHTHTLKWELRVYIGSHFGKRKYFHREVFSYTVRVVGRVSQV